jgi:hypothetical protein
MHFDDAQAANPRRESAEQINIEQHRKTELAQQTQQEN